MKERRLSFEESHNDYGELLDQVENDIFYALKPNTSEDDKKSIYNLMEGFTQRYLKERFPKDSEFRAYLHTRKKLLDQKIRALFAVDYNPKSVSYYESMILASGGAETDSVIATIGNKGEPIAIKLLKENPHPVVDEIFHHEQEVLIRLQDFYGDNYPDNLVKLYAYADKITVTERIRGGQSLNDIINQFDYLADEETQLKNRMDYFRDIVKGLHQLYDAGFKYHGDLKLSNCIVDVKGKIVLCDFSLVDSMAGRALPKYAIANGTARYQATENCIAFTVGDKPAQIGIRSDVFALGVMLHEIFTNGKDVYDRHTLPAEIKNNPHEILVRSYAGFIKEHNLPFRDADGNDYPDDKLEEFSKIFAHRRIVSHGCSFSQNSEVLDKIDSVIHKAIDPNPALRFKSPEEMLEALEPLFREL